MDPDENYFNANELNPSDTLTISEYHQICRETPSNFKICGQNIRSFNKNFEKFSACFGEIFPEVLVMTESWFTRSNTQNIRNYNAYHTIRCTDGSRGYGGVSVFVKSSFISQSIDELCFANQVIEISTVKVHVGSSSLFILGIYRPHSDSVLNFNDSLNEILNNRIIRNQTCVLIGDMNLNLFLENSNVNSYLNMMRSYHFIPIISKPTCYPVNSGSPSILDHIWINKISDFHGGVILTNITDHCAVYIHIPVNLDNQPSTGNRKVKFRLINDALVLKFRNIVANYEWSSLCSDNLDEFAENLISKLNSIYCTCFPLKFKYVRSEKNMNPWINSRLKKLVQAKSQFFRLFKLGVVSLQENNHFKNRVHKILHRAKLNYHKNLFERNRSNIRKTWDTINSLVNRNLNNRSIIKIINNSQEFVDSVDIAEVFNNYFTTIAEQLDSNLPQIDISPFAHVKPNNSSFFLNPVSPHECSLIIKNLKPSGQHIDTIPVFILKDVSDYVAPIISNFINKCFVTGFYPKCLKLACVTPVFKCGDRTQTSNYRPISILPTLNKVIEKCLYTRLNDFVLKNNLVSKNQYGFQKGRSTEQAVSNLTENIYSSLNSNEITLALFVDLSKAFDTVSHSILCKKLELYGIRGVPLQLISSYLTDRYQVTRINDSISSPRRILTGVPQGSHLGPLLFLLFINDLPNISDTFSPIMFADDLTVCFKSPDPLILKNLFFSETAKLVEWAMSNRLTINFEKTFYMLFTNRNISLSDLTMNNVNISQKFEAKFLGVFLDSKLKFDAHITYISSKIYKSVGILYRLRDYLPVSNLRSLYFAFINPYLLYCNLVWGGTYYTHLDTLVKLQKRAIRNVNKTSFLSHTNSLFISSKILKLTDIHKFQLAVYVYKLESVSEFTRNHDHNTRFRANLIPSFSRLTLTQHSLSFSAINFWNTLPNHIKQSRSLSIFKNRIRNYFVDQYRLENTDQ